MHALINPLQLRMNAAKAFIEEFRHKIEQRDWVTVAAHAGFNVVPHHLIHVHLVHFEGMDVFRNTVLRDGVLDKGAKRVGEYVFEGSTKKLHIHLFDDWFEESKQTLILFLAALFRAEVQNGVVSIRFSPGLLKDALPSENKVHTWLDNLTKGEQE